MSSCTHLKTMQTTDKFDLQGHRGARGLLPENSLPGFIKAVELGVTTLEMDAVITKDSQVVLSHEPWFSSTICSLPSGEPVPASEEKTYRIYDMSYEEIQKFDCGGRGHPQFPRQEPMKVTKPLLRDVIHAVEQYAFNHQLPLPTYNIETKSQPEGDRIFHPTPDVFVRLLFEVLVETGIRDRATIQSFDGRTLRAAREIDPALSLSLLVDYEEHHSLTDAIDTLGFVPAIYSPNYRLVDGELVREAHEMGMKITPWTVNDLEQMKQLLEFGVDGIITDYPDIGRELLTQ